MSKSVKFIFWKLNECHARPIKFLCCVINLDADWWKAIYRTCF